MMFRKVNLKKKKIGCGRWLNENERYVGAKKDGIGFDREEKSEVRKEESVEGSGRENERRE